VIDAGRPVRAIVANSGNANACTGPGGPDAAGATASAAALLLDAERGQILVCSTGPIGVPLPVERIIEGLPRAVDGLSAEPAAQAARAIMTTDTVPKFGSVRMRLAGREATLSGLAKGSGMIEPNMATMLAFLITDAAAEAAALQDLLREAVDASFNRITVDGDRSTNDTVLLLANGAAGAPPLTPRQPAWAVFRDAVFGLCQDLARQIVRDGEGATRVVTVRVTGAASAADAERAARAIANSPLNKTSFAGADPVWGRVMDAVGYSGAEVREDRVSIYYDDLAAATGGVASTVPAARLKDVVTREAFTLRADLGLGSGEAEVLTCDLTEGYVRINLVD
jgi:glutamate N-acetyltransferase/amino-acid N-acetyltransferase